MNSGTVVRVSGSVVAASGLINAGLYHRVAVGEDGLAGEIIRIDRDRATIQVYESTWGLRIGEPVVDTGQPFSVLLGPGLLGSVFDGVQRPLSRLAAEQGAFLRQGAGVEFGADPRVWQVQPKVRAGDTVGPGSVVAEVEETPCLRHRVLCPPATSGTVVRVHDGPRQLGDCVCELDRGDPIRLSHQWPVRLPRPHRGKRHPSEAAVTGQRILDCFFPLAHGGLAIIPGGFGTGKTVLEHVLAMYLDVDVVVYVGCGERGNEMAEILHQFAELPDPRHDQPLLLRTVLIANTSNMPVAAREASVYTGMTIAEYYRDMGYRTALLADSVSRWAEALREISSRLGELPGEEGYPSYLASRLSQFYERTGRVTCLTGDEGALTMVGAVSPPGGDLSEPVTQASLRLAGCFWALDTGLASQRHYPAVEWRESFSLYRDFLAAAWEQVGGTDWDQEVARLLELLSREDEVREIAQLVGYDALQNPEKLVLAAGAAIREGFLQQDASSDEDAYCSPQKTRLLMHLILRYLDRAQQQVESLPPEQAFDAAALRQLPRLRYRPEENLRALLQELDDA